MDILDILLDILLKPPQPFIGLFFNDLVKHAKNTCEKIVNGQHHGAEPLLALPGTIPVEWGRNSLNHEWENGLWRAFLLAAGNQMGL